MAARCPSARMQLWLHEGVSDAQHHSHTMAPQECLCWSPKATQIPPKMGTGRNIQNTTPQHRTGIALSLEVSPLLLSAGMGKTSPTSCSALRGSSAGSWPGAPTELPSFWFKRDRKAVWSARVGYFCDNGSFH